MGCFTKFAKKHYLFVQESPISTLFHIKSFACRAGTDKLPPEYTALRLVEPGGAGDQGPHGADGYSQHERLCSENGPQRLCAPGGPLPGAGAGVPPAAVRQQSQSGGAPCEHLRRPLPQRAPGAPKGLRRFMGASLRTVGEAGPGSSPVTRGSGPGRSPPNYLRWFSLIISLISVLLYPFSAINLISSKYLSNDSFASTNIRLVCAKISKNSK